MSYEVELYSVCLDILLENSNRFFLSIESLCIYSFSRALLDPCCSRSSSFCLIWTGFHFWRIQACILGWRNEHHLLFSILVCSHLTCERRESNTRWAKSLLSLRDPWEPSTSQLLFHPTLMRFPCTRSSSGTDGWWWRLCCCFLGSAQWCVIDTWGRIASEAELFYTHLHTHSHWDIRSLIHKEMCAKALIKHLDIWVHVYNTPISSQWHDCTASNIYLYVLVTLGVGLQKTWRSRKVNKHGDWILIQFVGDVWVNKWRETENERVLNMIYLSRTSLLVLEQHLYQPIRLSG